MFAQNGLRVVGAIPEIGFARLLEQFLFARR
jgi:hypothetical protein